MYALVIALRLHAELSCFMWTGHVASGGRWTGGGCILLNDDVENFGNQTYAHIKMTLLRQYLLLQTTKRHLFEKLHSCAAWDRYYTQHKRQRDSSGAAGML